MLELPTAGVELRDPLFLLGALLAPVVYRLASRTSASVRYSSLLLCARAPRGLRARLHRLPALLLALAAVALSIAGAGPRTGDADTRVKREGIAMMLVIDRSGSMNARDFVSGDFTVSRLDALKGVLARFVLGTDGGRGRPDDLIGAVAFATYADAVAPLTLDHANLMAIVDGLEVALERNESATAIGEGLGLAVERLRSHPAKSKVVVLLTDGVSNAGVLEPLRAAELAASQGIKVYTVGAGRGGFVPMPLATRDGRLVLRPQLVETDPEALRAIAERTGGRYFTAEDEGGLVDTYDAIDALERTEITELRYLQYREHYAVFVVLALVLMATSALGGATLLRRLP